MRLMKIQSKKLKYLIHTVRELDRWLIVSFVVAILCLLNYETSFITRFWDNRFTKGLNVVIVQMLYAYVTGFVFYLLIELIPNHKKVIALSRFINNNISDTNRYTKSLLNQICLTDPALPEGHRINLKEIGHRCAKINIYTTRVSTWFYHENSFRNYVLWTCDKIRASIDQINGYSYLLNDDWTIRLSHIQDSIHNVEDLLEVNGNKSTLGIVSVHLWALYGEVQRLNELSNEYYKRYHRISSIKSPPGTWLPDDIFFEVNKAL
jgi:hypothetical protein